MCARSGQRHKAIAHLLDRKKEQSSIKHSDRFFKVDRFMLTYEVAYREYFGISCLSIIYAHGWYYVHGRSQNGRLIRIALCREVNAQW